MVALRVLALLALIAAVCNGETTDCSYVALMKHLNLTSSSELPVMRPVKHWTTPTIVLIDMLLDGILEVDEKFQTVMSHISVYMKWKNEFLAWNSSVFCGMELLPVSLSLLWVPDIVIREDVSDTSSNYMSPLATLSSNGWVHSSLRHVLTSTCKLDLKLFPFDMQICNLSFGSMSFPDDIISMRARTNDSTLFRLSEQTIVTHGEWALKNIDITLINETKVGFSQSALVYTITILRKPLLYVVNFIVPLFYLLILDLASFFISEARGEKLGFKITILLSISVLLLILKDILPSTEDNLPMIANFCVGIFALVGISVLEAMVVTFLSDLDGYCDQNSRRFADSSVEIELNDGSHIENDINAEVNKKGSHHQEWPSVSKLLNQILQEVKSARQEVNRGAQTGPGFYKRVAHIFDCVFFTFYLMTVVVFLSYMYITWINVYK
ncbi:5-hydroxytryptamine receptor 3A-like isoform X1 [Takifugu flavidus]|uniref:5-hydroxytryptamine receptor 3A-like isoform X1 n=1 Tax=Takifugu flavidus TaxID=433684 RepID=UPI002544190A|nr:5-hydroxytryptamine receptor 3A-like isoform X1 [Takifugu flavidus]